MTIWYVSSEFCKLDCPGSNQPTSTSVINATRRIQGEGRMQQAQVMQGNWFSLYPWLTIYETRHKLCCFYCCNAIHKNLLTFSKKAEDTFSKVGFYNWKRALEKFENTNLVKHTRKLL